MQNNKAKIISIVGAGGKTSTMLQLAREHAEAGKKVVITTTTHIRKPENIPFIDINETTDTEEARQSICELLCNENIICAADGSKGQKLCSMPEPILDMLSEMDIVLIIEADGAKMLPIKAPESYEPVIYKKTDIVIAVIGADAIGEKISDVGFRIERLCELLGKQPHERIDIYDLVKIYTDEKGLKKSVPENVTYIPVLNKADNEMRMKYAYEINRILKKDYNIELKAARHGLFISCED